MRIPIFLIFLACRPNFWVPLTGITTFLAPRSGYAERAEVMVREVREALAAQRELARNTVQTMIVRLEEKGWLKHREDGRTFIYSAARPRSVSLGAKVSQMVDRLFAGSPEEMVTALIEYRGLSADEAERIREMIDKADGTQKRSSKREKKP